MRKNRIAVNIAFFINGFIYANWVSRLPRIQELFGANNQTIGIVLLTLALGATAAMPFTGWVIIKNGSRRITVLSVLMYCLFIPVIPFISYWVYALPMFFLMGIFTGMLDVAMNAQAVFVEQQYKRPIMTSFHAFFSVGMALGAWCGALFAEAESSLIWHFGIVTLGSIVLIPWMKANLIPDKPSPEEKHDGPLFRLPNAALVSVGIIAFCAMLGEGSMADWSVNYMEKIASSDKALAPIALSAFATAMTLGRIFGDKARAMLGDGRLIIAGGLLATFGLVSALVWPIPYVVIVGCFLVGLGLATIVPITYSIAGNNKDLPSGVGLAMVTTVGYTGLLVGPALIGFVAEWQNLRIALAFVAVLLVVMTGLGFAYRKSKV